MLNPGVVRVRIEELAVEAYLGVHDFEQKKRRKVTLDVDFEYQRPAEDMLSAAVDYRVVRDRVLAVVEDRRFNLVETMAQAILEAVRSDARVSRVSVQVHKPGALRQAQSVAALVEWGRET